jgi:hypothetical protein
MQICTVWKSYKYIHTHTHTHICLDFLLFLCAINVSTQGLVSCKAGAQLNDIHIQTTPEYLALMPGNFISINYEENQ